MPPIIVRKVRPAALPDVITPAALPAGAFGGAEAQALETIGRTVSGAGAVSAQLDKLRIKDQELSDRTEATNAFVTYQGASNEKESALKTRKNLLAQGATVDYDTFSKESFNKIRETIQSDGAKLKFDSDVQLHNLNKRNTMMVYEREETIKGRNASFEAAADISVQEGMADFKNPNTHTIAVDHIEENARSLQLQNGWSKDETDLWISNKQSPMFEEIVRQWAIEDAEIGQLSFDTNKDKIDPQKYDDLQGLLKTNDTSQKAKIASDTALAQFDNEKDALNWVDKNVKDADQHKRAKENIRTKFSDNKRISEQDRLILNDKQTGDIDTMLNQPIPNESNIKAYVDSIENGTDRAKQRAYYKAELKRQNADIVTDPDKLTEYYSNPQQFKSIGDVRRATAVLSKKDATDFETWWQEGGTVGGLSEPELRAAFKTYTEFNASDIPVTYQNARRFIVSMVGSLPAGASMTSTNLDTWMKQAVRGEADSGNIPTKESIGVTSRMTEKQRDNVISQMEAGNDARVKAGKRPYPINPDTIAKASLNVYPRLKVTQPITPPVIVAPLEPSPAPVVELPDPAETIRPFGDAAQPLSPRNIQESRKDAGITLNDREAILIAADQYPKSVQSNIINLLRQDIPEQKIQEQIDNLLKGSGFEAIPKPEARR